MSVTSLVLIMVAFFSFGLDSVPMCDMNTCTHETMPLRVGHVLASGRVQSEGKRRGFITVLEVPQPTGRQGASTGRGGAKGKVG